MKQTSPFTVAQYLWAGCGQLNQVGGVPDLIGLGLHAVTDGMMCNGCPHLERKCEAFRLLQPLQAASREKQVPKESVREEAARLGISINAVRRSRAAQ